MSSRDKESGARRYTRTAKAPARSQSSKSAVSTPSNQVSSHKRSSTNNKINKKPSSISNLRHGFQNVKERSQDNEEAGDSSEMASTSLISQDKSIGIQGCNIVEQETNVDTNYKENQDTDDDESATLLESPQIALKLIPTQEVDVSTNEALPNGWEQHSDNAGPYYWHIATGLIQRTLPNSDSIPRKDSLVLCYDDEEINQASFTQRTSSDEEDPETGAALTIADDTLNDTSITFVVYLVGCCEFDETQLVSTTNTKAIQKCILKLSNKPTKEESTCWGLDQSQPVLMRLIDNLIQFTDIKSQALLRSQPIPTIKTWAVDDDNNFAFVVEDATPVNQSASLNNTDEYDSVDYALLNAPIFMCYVFRSMDDDDMSCKVAAKLNEEINRFKMQMSDRINKNTKLQQMVGHATNEDQTDADEDLNDFEESCESTMCVRYIGKVQVPRPTGVDTLNVAIDKCLADASKAQLNRITAAANSNSSDSAHNLDHVDANYSPLIDAKLHVSPSNVIVENKQTGEIIVECRIRYLTFIGISRRDIRWFSFIMQNVTNKTFVAHCFECHPTAGPICEAIQSSCMKMYEKVVKSHHCHQQDATSIIPKSSKIRDTLAKTLSRIKLSPII